jgi:hypothetical protein
MTEPSKLNLDLDNADTENNTKDILDTFDFMDAENQTLDIKDIMDVIGEENI